MIDIVESYSKHGFKFFQTGQFNLNIGWVRSRNSRANHFDDVFFCIYRDSTNRWRKRLWSCTSDPGQWYLTNFYPGQENKGCAILCHNRQYLSAYAIGTHIDHRALIQVAPVSIIRDNNKDKYVDFLNQEELTPESGMFGINIHGPWNDGGLVDNRSAGCTVFECKQDLQDFLLICDQAVKLYGNRFTLTTFLDD